jgi:DNA-binding beta-propeller fold protein YncE
MRDNRAKIVIVAVLAVALIIVLLLLLRGCNREETVAGGDITAATSITDLKTPLAVTVGGDGKIYISDTGEKKVRVYDGNGAYLYDIDSGQDDQGQPYQYYSPYGLAVDDGNNRLYIADYMLRVVDPEGNFLYNLTPPPEAVTVDQSESAIRPNQIALTSDRVYVTSRDGIYIFDAAAGQYLEHWGTRGAAVGQFDFPNGIAVDENTGNIFVVDVNNWRLISMTEDGRYRWVLGIQDNGQVKSPFRLPRSVAVGPDGRVYVSDAPDRILVLDQDGNLTGIIGERGTEETKMNFPEGLFITDDNRLLFADRENNRVQVWQLSDNISEPDAGEVKKFADGLRWYWFEPKVEPAPEEGTATE